ncbi:hypothetical protein [Rickettsia endosymbiont of Halotydeus destructor]|uniref:hypothetical protein n=1 Tax=Rickettsia endosymbiont of Halotydeus destructor TaxID=2996754 RepID=UPI003BAFCC9B
MVKPIVVYGALKSIGHHSSSNRNPENYSHPEFISGSLALDAETSSAWQRKSGFPFELE